MIPPDLFQIFQVKRLVSHPCLHEKSDLACSRTQGTASGEVRTHNPSILTQVDKQFYYMELQSTSLTAFFKPLHAYEFCNVPQNPCRSNSLMRWYSIKKGIQRHVYTVQENMHVYAFG